jgi:ABC-type oligopeptide transport system ATPase subunit
VNGALLELAGVRKAYPGKGAPFGRRAPERVALDNVDLAMAKGEIHALVGESGSGKSTLGRLALRLEAPSAGRIVFDGQDITRASEKDMRPLRPRMQIVFQDPSGALDPRYRASEALAEPFLAPGRSLPKNEIRHRAAELMRLAGLPESLLAAYPHQMSGGQRQRLCIARALALNPDFLVLDEPVSALDVSVAARILALLADLRARLNLTYLFITHDLSVAARLCDSVSVLHQGRIVESGPAGRVLTSPSHPYTVSLIAAVPVADPTMRQGALPPAPPPGGLNPPGPPR